MLTALSGGLLEMIKPVNLLDIAIIALVAYNLMLMLKGTRAVQLIKGLFVLLLMTIISDFVGLATVNWLLVQTQKVLIIAIPIVFQPELRRALEQLGTGSIWNRFRPMAQEREALNHNIDQIIRCMVAASKSRTGVLMAIRRQTGLGEYVDTGIQINGTLSAELLGNIFIVNTPLHDGAVIIDGGTILAASCFLPLSESNTISKELGTRHRAAIGLTEVSDAVVVIVSEETGAMSIADHGVLVRDVKEQKLRELLTRKLEPQAPPTTQLLSKWRRKNNG